MAHQLACVKAPLLLGWRISWASLKPQFLIAKSTHSGKVHSALLYQRTGAVPPPGSCGQAQERPEGQCGRDASLGLLQLTQTTPYVTSLA